MKKDNRSFKIIAVFAFVLLTIVIVGIACSLWPFDITDPRSELQERYQRELDKSLVINETGETTVRGEVTHTGLGCETGSHNCHFILQFNNLPVYVYYWQSKEDSCINKDAAKQAELISNGDMVEVFGKYSSPGAIWTCDSKDYYIQKLP